MWKRYWHVFFILQNNNPWLILHWVTLFYVKTSLYIPIYERFISQLHSHLIESRIIFNHAVAIFWVNPNKWLGESECSQNLFLSELGCDCEKSICSKILIYDLQRWWKSVNIIIVLELSVILSYSYWSEKNKLASLNICPWTSMYYIILIRPFFPIYFHLYHHLFHFTSSITFY